MKIFVTDKYRIITFAFIALLIGLSSAFIKQDEKVSVYSQNREIPIYCVDRNDKKISITFDCAWGNEDIDKIIKILKKHDCKASFFVLGTWANKYPDSVKALYKAGHEIGNHSYNHSSYTAFTEAEMIDDINKCSDEIKNITGEMPKIFRAPSGDYNNLILNTAKKLNMTYLQWSVDSLDWKNLNQSEMEKRILPNVKDGSILLFHNSTDHTADSLDGILTKLEKQGYSFVKVSELIYKDNFFIDNTGCQHLN